jgi:S1-C subfamily serine protease
VRLQSIQLGSVRVASPVVDLSEDRAGSMSDSNYQGNIGSGLLSRFIVTFDYGHQKMYLTRIEPPPDGVGQYDRSGMWINAAPDGYKVMSVVNGGPAALAGIAVGDVIVTLDGYRGQPEGLSDARAELRTRAAGSIVQVTLRRGKDLRKVRLVLRDQI